MLNGNRIPYVRKYDANLRGIEMQDRMICDLERAPNSEPHMVPSQVHFHAKNPI